MIGGRKTETGRGTESVGNTGCSFDAAVNRRGVDAVFNTLPVAICRSVAMRRFCPMVPAHVPVMNI